MQDKRKNVVIMMMSILIVVLLVLTCYLIFDKKNELKEITGKVLLVDEKYVIIETNGSDYLINGIENTYEVGDEVSFSYKEKDLNFDDNPPSIKIQKEKLLKRAPKKDDTSQDDEKTTNEETNEDPNHTTSSSPKPSKSADEEVLSYIDDLDKKFKASDITDGLKNGFITLVDFIFYEGSIKGHTFEDLSENAKLKVLEMTIYFDEKIDKYFPGYKESISTTTGKIYTTIKNEIISTYLNVATAACETNSELCTTAKNTFTEIKKNLGLTWSLLKEIAKDGVTSLKKWYEIWSGK